LLTDLTNSNRFTPKLENSFHFFAGARLLLAPGQPGHVTSVTLTVLKIQFFFPLKTLIVGGIIFLGHAPDLAA
jgi:hypothetical protein